MTTRTVGEAQGEPFTTFLYNSSQGTVLGRTASSWAKISFFYTVYYTFLACLMYGSVKLCEYKLDNRIQTNIPTVVSRTDQPGISIEPCNTYLDDNSNTDFKYEKSSDESFSYYLDASLAFLKNYPDSVEQQFNKKMLTDAYKNGEIIYFLRVNKVLNWSPIAYMSKGSAVAAGFEEMSQITDNTYNANGVYFTCTSSTNSKIEFLKIGFFNGQRSWDNKNVGYIAGSEFEGYKPPVDGKTKACTGSTCQGHPFVALKVTATGENVQQKVDCRPVTQNIQLQRNINVGLVEFGFTVTP